MFDRDPVSGLRGSLFYRAPEPGGRAYRINRLAIESSWGRTFLSVLVDVAEMVYRRWRPDRIQTAEGAVDRRDTVRNVVGSLKALDEL
jgi:hypothetical protein